MRQSAVLALMFAVMSGGAYAQDAAGDRITGAIVLSELRALGQAAKLDADPDGDPRVNLKVDGHDWAVYFYNCGPGSLEQRACTSFQFFSGYKVANNFSPQVLNRWNTEKRFAKAYLVRPRDGSNNARIEIDVLLPGTGADPAKSFRAHYGRMKELAADFRKAIGRQ